MDDERWQKIQAIFEEAAERPPDQRARFLDEACGRNNELRAEVERLLSHDSDAPSGFMRPRESESPARWTSSASETDALVGTTIGRYRIKGVIDAGGMGTVYLAEQASPKRDVALKILRAGIASRSVMKRFEYESQILARLRHPNIARVYEAGVADGSYQPSAGSSQLAEPAEPPPREGGGHKRTEKGFTVQRGVPYFAMEYVQNARMITQYADDAKLSIRQRLELFLQVCDAVHYGHLRGVIHRDLKPGNILVSDEAIERRSDVDTRAASNSASFVASSPRGSVARCKLIDFGVARCTDSDIAVTTMHTDVGQLIGTLQYMSPEQCAADALEIDTRSDVYSLGVVLFELLTGRLPYDVSNMTIHSAARVICEREPAKPSGFERRLRGDLEMILLKALAKDREKRYASAAGLAEDVHRYFRGEPISARAPSAWTRGVRWVGRHPVIATACLCLFIGVATLAATAVSVWWWGMQPYRIVRYRYGQPVTSDVRNIVDEVRLITRNGHVLHTWGGAGGAIAFADLVECPDALGGDRLAVIGFRASELGRYSRQVCAFDIVDDLEEPDWSRQAVDGELPPLLRGSEDTGGESFEVQAGLVADVFPGSKHPGEEIVAIFSHKSSKRIIRIYNLEGDGIYQVWHDGALVAPYWMSGAGLLVFAGDSHLGRWDEGGELLVAEPIPLVVFAIRPEPGVIHNSGFLSMSAGPNSARPVWYKCIYLEDGKPATHGDILAALLAPPIDRDSDCFVRLHLSLKRDADLTMCWLLDQSGDEVAESRDVSDSYKIALEQGDRVLPDPSQIKLGPMPPLPAPSDEARQASSQGEGKRE